ncbi:formin-like protein 1 [Olea europaea var. sylvestris]|uniref:formin-like protein 1 n=1 Tax=Olea europaea var. sylvestris TaxID=158386 RepID=UPI000C1D7B5D|nr:formin-like protein 1 [Olea europaea var. sylvestris]
MLTFFFLFLSCALRPISSTATHNRRILHQPFQPQDSIPPSQPPVPSPPTTPKYPFSTATTPNNTPFFPSYPSPPPPPSPASFASFPVNISSLNLPQPSKSKSASSKLLIAAVASVIAAVAIVSLVVFLHFRRRRNRSSNDSKSQRSDNYSSARINQTPNNNHIPKLQRPSQTSSEFLYLGTLVNSHGGNGIDSRNVYSGSRTSDSNASNSRKLNSPELHPLPPLKTHSFSHNYRNAEAFSSKDEEDEQFYSPKGSLNDRDSSIGTGSASRRVFAAVEVENFNGSTSNSSSTYTSSVTGSGSVSPVRSVSLSVSPAISLSPRNSMLKSPDLIEIQMAPTPMQTTMASVPAPSGLLFRESASPSPPSSSSPERCSRRSVESSPRISNASDQNVESPVRISSPLQQNVTVIPPPPPPPAVHLSVPRLPPAPVSVPPPAPPPPNCKLWESPRTLTPPARKQVLEPPVLTTPFRPISIDTPPLVSPIELPSSNADTVSDEKQYSNEALEKHEELTPKPKLKPLHWDKVRASSDREMVWDQLKTSSFKLNEEMIETLFLVNTPNPNPKEMAKRPVLPSPNQDSGNRVLDPKKSQNIAILLRALNVTVEEVCEALLEGIPIVLV